MESRRFGARWLVGVVVVVVLASVVIMAMTWPTGDAPGLGARPTTFVDAEVRSVERTSCPSLEVVEATESCRLVTVRLHSGPEDGATATLRIPDSQFEAPALRPGDRIVLLDSGAEQDDIRYSYADQQRRGALVALAAAFVVVVVAVGRGRGVRALAGLVLSVGILVVYLVPALARGSAAVPVALAASVMVAVAAIYLAHGVSVAATVAIVGTVASLAATTILGVAAASATRLVGLGGTEAQALMLAGGVDVRGLLAAGFVVGALGVLDDVTVTQVSTVSALRQARPDLAAREVYRAALTVGRDHVATTVNTLVLAYAGASLPLLLFFAEGRLGSGRVLTSEIVAVEIVRMLVGSIGLVLAVPVTTALAGWTVEGGQFSGHDHVHGDRGPSWDDFAPLEE